MNSCWRRSVCGVFWSHVCADEFCSWALEDFEETSRMKESVKKASESGTGIAAIRVVVADDHPVVRFGVRNMLESESGFEVVGEAEDGDVAITQTIELEPDILLLDL